MVKIVERKSNFEILRIIAMLMIISFHYVAKSGYNVIYLNYNSFIVEVFWFFGELGVNLFILITGYFMVKDKMSYKRVILLAFSTFFYNLVNVLLNYHYANIPIKKTDILFPVIFSKYWFVTAYILVYIFTPYLNLLINNMKEREYRKFLLTLLVLWCFIPTIFGLTKGTSESLLYYSRFIWLMIMYFIGAYIRLFDIKVLDQKRSVIASAITFILMVISIPFIYKYRYGFSMLGTTDYAYLWTPNNVFMLVLSVCIFYFFAKLEVKSIKIINTLASTTLGIYMLHDGLFNHYLWYEIFGTHDKLASMYSIFYILGSALFIFGVGAIIDLIRQKIENVTLKKILDKKIFDILN